MVRELNKNFHYGQRNLLRTLIHIVAQNLFVKVKLDLPKFIVPNLRYYTCVSAYRL